MTVWKTSVWVFVCSLSCLFPYLLRAQSIPEIPLDIEFAGVTVNLNEQSRAQLQREVGQLYANRANLQRDIESLRQLTPLLEPLLKARQLPMDYRYAALPFAGDASTGYWGLTSARAQALNLLVNNAVDERYHPILATETVTAHLQKLHTVSDNYALTLLRYVQGDTLTDRLGDKGNATYLVLDAQSPALMWKIIARKLAFEREEPVLRLTQPYLLYELRHAAGSSLRTIGRQLRLDEDRFKPFNTWLKAGLIPDTKDYPVLVRVTADEFPAVKSRDGLRSKPTVVGEGDVGFPTLTKLPSSTVPTFEQAVFYTINDKLGVQAQPCDNAITLAHFGKISPRKFLSYNDLSDRDVVHPGQIYYVEQKAKRAKVPFHVVQKNQTMREVSSVYGVRLKSLLSFNHILPTQRVQTGRIVWLQKKRPKSQPATYKQVLPEEVKPEVEDSSAIEQPTDSVAHRTDSLSHQIDSLRTQIDSLRQLVATQATAIQESKRLADSSRAIDVPKLHVVKRGETYYHLSQVYRISLSQLYAWNKLSERIPLEIGRKLIVGMIKQQQPVGSDPGVAVVQPAEKISYHVVKRGQTVYRVALINKVSVKDLMRWNNLKNYTIEIGQKLIIRKAQ